MRGPPNSRITLTIRREGVDKPIELSMQREVIHIQVVKSAAGAGDIGYIRLTSFNEQTDAGLKRALEQLKQQSGGQLRGIDARPAQQPGRAARPGGRGVGRFHRPRRDRLDPRRATPRTASAGTPRATTSPAAADGGADQRRLGLGERDRRRRAAGPSPRGAARHPQLRQGLGADRDPAARQRRDAADHGALLHAVGPRRSRASASRRTSRCVRAATRRPHFGPEREADLNHVLTNQGGTPQQAAPPRTDLPPIAKDDPEQAARGLPEIRSDQAGHRLPAAAGAGGGARRWPGRSAPRRTDVRPPGRRDAEAAGARRSAAACALLGWFWVAVLRSSSAAGRHRARKCWVRPARRFGASGAGGRAPGGRQAPSRNADLGAGTSRPARAAPHRCRPRNTRPRSPPPDPALARARPDIPGGVPAAHRRPMGGMPMQVYARRFDRSRHAPRVGLLLAGVGMNEADSEEAIRTLPGGDHLGLLALCQPARSAAGRSARSRSTNS